ncbi:MAG: InlB B-repeat-containing protein [Bacteroidales bacterium]|nr:InlB B-repeat-containing protein [Bacteroidales bacterium]
MKKYSFLIICTLLTGLLFTTCEPWIVPEAVFVNFNANGGQGDMKAQRFEDGEKQNLELNSFTREYYNFAGWNTRADGKGLTYRNGQIVSLNKSCILYAQWERRTYSLTFNANGGTGTMDPQTFEEGVSQAIAANTFTRDGYNFAGWNTKADGSGTSYTNKHYISLKQDMTLYAQWERKGFILTFNANGGTGTMDPQTFEEGVARTITANSFTRSGYTFTGWNTNADGSGTSYTDKQSITLSQNITLYAQWELFTPTYVDLGLSVKWANCNVGATFPEDYGDYFAWGETSPKDDYSWSTYKYCNGSSSTLTKYNTNSSNGTVDNKTTLELSDDAARVNWGDAWRIPTDNEWDKLINNCTWTWTSQNGVSGYKVTSKINGNSIFMPATGYRNGTSFTTVGYYGYYWSSTLDEGDPRSAYGMYFYSGNVLWSSSMRNYGRTVRAVYGDDSAAQTFTLTFNANGGTGTMAAQTFEAGVSQAIKANTFTRSGYTFTGWNTNADGSGTSYTDKQSITLSQDITLYAQWESAGGSGGGSSISGTENGHDYVDLGLPSGLKWATCNIGSTTPYGYGDYFAWGETAPKTNYAWSAYKHCNGSDDSLTKYNTSSGYGTVDRKTTLELNDDAARANWGGKWRMPTKAEQNELRNNCTWTWTTQNGVKGYKVTSKTNGNSIFMPAAGNRDGTSLRYVGSDGYYWSNSCSDYNNSAYGMYFDSYNVYLESDARYYGRTVRAVFSDNDKPSTFVTLTFNANGGTGTMAAQTFEAGVSQAIAANAFTRSGYTFTGWNTNADGSGTSYTDKQSITISQDITLYAQWKKDIVNYTVTFNANGGTGTMAAQTFEAGVSQALAANKFTRDGYTFAGWNTAADGSGTSYTDGQEITLTQDITLYAQWNHKQVVSGTENGHDYVDLGLSVKWATCNVGATTPDGYGDYFAWGETAPKTNYDWSTYKYCNGSSSTLTKYNTESSRGIVDNKTTLEISDDAARAYWGGSWRMPSEAELDELLNNCIWTWSVHNGVEGYKVISKTNGNSIFLPAAGCRVGTSVYYAGSRGGYWSSSLYESTPYNAYLFYFNSSFVDYYYYQTRFDGHAVRAVCP